MIILSIDPGCKNLGYSLIKVNNPKLTFNNIDTNTEQFFKDNNIEFIELNNINLGNYTNIYDKVIKLLLNILDKINLDKDFLHIIIEKQMKISVNISEISSIIHTFFITYFTLNKDKINNYKITIISPHYKNKIAEKIDLDGSIRIKFINQYQYNKHLVELYFLKLNEKLNLIDNNKYINGAGKHILKLNDIADSFIQILSFFKFYLKK
jgi:hypothetical protein